MNIFKIIVFYNTNIGGVIKVQINNIFFGK